MDHEDPRYFVSGSGGPWKRTWYSMVHEFVVHNDNGTMMPAYSRFVADYGMPFIAQQWRPGRFRTTPDGLRAGTCSLGLVRRGRKYRPGVLAGPQEEAVNDAAGPPLRDNGQRPWTNRNLWNCGNTISPIGTKANRCFTARGAARA